MHNDSIESPLLRHYGHGGPLPSPLEQRLITSIRHEGVLRQQQEDAAARIRAYRISRRRVVKLVAISSAGLGILGAGLDLLETALSGTENIQSAFP